MSIQRTALLRELREAKSLPYNGVCYDAAALLCWLWCGIKKEAVSHGRQPQS